MLRKIWAWLLVFMVIGFYGLSTQKVDPSIELIPVGQTWEVTDRAIKACKDSLKMSVDYTNDYGSERIFVQLKSPTTIADCSTQFGHIDHVTLRKRAR